MRLWLANSYHKMNFNIISYVTNSGTTQIHHYRILSSFDFFLRVSSQGFKTGLLGEGFHTLINGGLFSSPTNVGHHNPLPFGPSVLAGTLSFLQSMWDRSQIHPLWGPASLLAHSLVSTPLRRTAKRLAHRPVSGSDTICNGPDPPLVDIVLFGLSLSGFPLRL